MHHTVQKFGVFVQLAWGDFTTKDVVKGTAHGQVRSTPLTSSSSEDDQAWSMLAGLGASSFACHLSILGLWVFLLYPFQILGGSPGGYFLGS